MGRKNRGRKQQVVVETREVVEWPEEIDVEITTEDLRPEAINSNPANRRRVGKEHSVHVVSGLIARPKVLRRI